MLFIYKALNKLDMLRLLKNICENLLQHSKSRANNNDEALDFLYSQDYRSSDHCKITRWHGTSRASYFVSVLMPFSCHFKVFYFDLIKNLLCGCVHMWYKFILCQVFFISSPALSLLLSRCCSLCAYCSRVVCFEICHTERF